jgi:phosphatidylethanolamine-binding protein (PEBP) family uncharacterized protein
MPFSSSICLTNTGTLPLGSSVDIYSDYDSYSQAFQTNVSLSDLTSNCPYILTNIPDGTTQIKFEDTVSHCCYNLTISPNNLCDLFGIQLAGFSSTTISQIVAGLLTSSVGANITDYIIDWYGPENNTTIAFTSGFGILFGPYQQTHPFNRLSLPGYYIPMIRQIRINNINYSITGGTGFVQANINCLANQTVEVFPSICSGNREEPIFFYPEYNNYYVSDTAAFNTPPESLSMGFDLDINSSYFAWQFRPYTVSDTIKISFNGDNYPTPIVLEYYTIGDEYTEINVSVIPKTVKVLGGFFKKVTILKNFLRSENDYLTIEVIPNPTISRTNWELYFECLPSFDCSTCLDSLYPYKIIESTITITPLSCNQYRFYSNLSGCTNSVLQSSDVYKYLTKESSIEGSLNSEFGGTCSTTNGLIDFVSTQNTGSTVCNAYTVCNSGFTSCSPFPFICDINPGGYISFNKTNATVGGPGNIYMQFLNESDFNLYYNSYLNNVLNYGLGTPLDNTNIDYYRYFILRIPVIPAEDPDRTCASDIANEVQYQIHTSSVVTTGITGNFYFLNITMPLMTSGITFNTCDLDCTNGVDQMITNVNNASISTNNQFNFFSNIGAKKLNPISGYVKFVKTTFAGSQQTQEAFLRLTDLVNNTIPMSGDNYTIIPSLSAQTCDFTGYQNGGEYLGVTRYRKPAWRYTTGISILNNFELFTNDYNLTTTFLIYQYNLNTNTLLYKNQNYFIGTNTTLTSSSITNGSLIPVQFKNNTICSELNNSPQMSWSVNPNTLLPTQTITSYEILCEDVNASGTSPNGYFVHWYVTGINSSQTSISVNGSWNGSPTVILTDYGSGDRVNGWNGPCPPSGTHNYRIQVKAILSDNTTLPSNYLTFTST